MAPAEWRQITEAEKGNVNWTEDVALKIENEDVLFVIPRKSALLSELLKELLEEMDPGTEAIVPLVGNKNLDVPTMKTVVEYLCHYNGDQPTVLEKPLKRHLRDVLARPQPWEKEYVYTRLYENDDEKKHSQLMKTVDAANFLRLGPLRELCCAAIASMFYGRNEKQICELFGVTREFTEEEKKKVEIDYPWIVEMTKNASTA